jgi:hypothetical protein
MVMQKTRQLKMQKTESRLVIANAIPDPPTDHRMVTPAQPLSVYIGLRGKLTANAADVVPPYAPPPSVYVPPAFTWTGFYLGGNLGAAWALNTVTDTQSGPNLSNGSNNGVFIGGGQLGFNWQVSNIVLGFEWDFDRVANNNNTGNGLFIPAVGTIQVTPNNNWITTLAARFGVGSFMARPAAVGSATTTSPLLT